MKVVCTVSEHNGKWYSRVKILGIKLWGRWCAGPKKNDIVTVVGEDWEQGEKYYAFLEWPGEEYHSIHFVPFRESTSELKEVTYSEIKKEVPVSAN